MNPIGIDNGEEVIKTDAGFTLNAFWPTLRVDGWMFSVQVVAETITAISLAQNNHS